MLKHFRFYVLFLCLYPVLALGSHNINEIKLTDTLRPMAVSLLLGSVVLGLAILLLRDWERASLVAAFILLLFFTYGQVYDGWNVSSWGDAIVVRHRTLGPLWLALLFGGVYLLGLKSQIPRATTPWLNVLTALLLIYPVSVMIVTGVRRAIADNRAFNLTAESASLDLVRKDIYYIILDGYARQDALKEVVGYDNSEFITELETRGFYVAECSQSNYAQTGLSLASSLNFDYIDTLSAETQDELNVLIRHSAVRGFLEAQGYTTVAFPTGYGWTEWTDADIYPTPAYQSALPTEFENLVLATTMLRVPLDFGMIDFAAESRADRYRARVLSTLENLKNIPENAEPTFTFAHLVIPHFPYVFGPEGEEVDYTSEGHGSVVGYRNQVIFISHEILKVVDRILRDSAQQPIIVIQGDHGAPVVTGSEALRMRNLDAYYLPSADTAPYRSISPVNTFRLILNAYFGQSLPLLSDRSFYSDSVHPFDLSPIPNSCPEEQ